MAALGILLVAAGAAIADTSSVAVGSEEHFDVDCSQYDRMELDTMQTSGSPLARDVGTYCCEQNYGTSECVL